MVFLANGEETEVRSESMSEECYNRAVLCCGCLCMSSVLVKRRKNKYSLMPCYNGKGEKWHGYGTRTSILCRAWDLHETHPPWMPIFYLQLYIMIFHIKAASFPLSALMFISQSPPSSSVCQWSTCLKRRSLNCFLPMGSTSAQRRHQKKKEEKKKSRSARNCKPSHSSQDMDYLFSMIRIFSVSLLDLVDWYVASLWCICSKRPGR